MRQNWQLLTPDHNQAVTRRLSRFDRRDQGGAVVRHALTVCDEGGPGLATADEILAGAHKGPCRARFSVHGITRQSLGTVGKVRGPVGGGPAVPGSGPSFGLIRLCPWPFTGDRGPHVRAGRDAGGRW
jgi:hypothetical protein